MSSRSGDASIGDELTISLRCPPELEGLVPVPELTASLVPAWLAGMPASEPSALLGGVPVRTVKHCPPFIDALRFGVLFPLSADIKVSGGEFEWDWKAPPLASSEVTLAPLGVHLPEQVRGVPLGTDPDRFVIKFTNYWTVGLPPGWSMLFTHPLNRMDLPFRTLSGVVDCDAYASNFVHFPALWHDDAFEGVLPRGTPVAQGIPVLRRSIGLEHGILEGPELARHREVQAALEESAGVYRREYRAPNKPAGRR